MENLVLKEFISELMLHFHMKDYPIGCSLPFVLGRQHKREKTLLFSCYSIAGIVFLVRKSPHLFLEFVKMPRILRIDEQISQEIF